MMHLKERKLQMLGVAPPERTRHSGYFCSQEECPISQLDPRLTVAIQAANLDPDKFEGSFVIEYDFDQVAGIEYDPNGNELHMAVDEDRGIAVAVYVRADIPDFPPHWLFCEAAYEVPMFWMSEYRDQSEDLGAPENLPSGPSSYLDFKPQGIALQ